MVSNIVYVKMHTGPHLPECSKHAKHTVQQAYSTARIQYSAHRSTCLNAPKYTDSTDLISVLCPRACSAHQRAHTRAGCLINAPPL